MLGQVISGQEFLSAFFALPILWLLLGFWVEFGGFVNFLDNKVSEYFDAVNDFVSGFSRSFFLDDSTLLVQFLKLIELNFDSSGRLNEQDSHSCLNCQSPKTVMESIFKVVKEMYFSKIC